MFKTQQKAEQVLNDCTNPEELTPHYIDEVCEMEIRKIKLDCLGYYEKAVMSVRWNKEYDEDSDDFVWRKV